MHRHGSPTLVPCALAVLLAACNADPGTTSDATTTATSSSTIGPDAPTTSPSDPEPATSTTTTTTPPETTTTVDPSTPTTSEPDDTTATTTGAPDLGPAIIKINVGGPAVADFLADDGDESPYRVGPDSVVYTNPGVAPDASVPADLPLEVLNSGRVEPPELSGGTGQLHWRLPVTPGEYQVRLHFAGPSQGPGTRVLTVAVDDVVALPDLDVSALTADGAAATVTFPATADDWLDLELVRVPGSDMPQLAAIELFGDGALRDGPAGVVRHITPAGGGSGASLDDPAALTQLPSLIAASAPGDEVWIHAGLGDYTVTGEISISAGGQPGAPIVIRGVGNDWHDPGRPRLLGDRADPWTADGQVGGVVFRLASGADNLHFTNLGFANLGNGCWRITKPVTGLRLDNIVATNVHRLLEDFVSGSGAAGATGLILKDISVRGYARAVARLQYDSAAVLFEDVFGDSEAQQYESFSTGITLDGTAHDVVLRRSVMLNNRQQGVAGYWNADGFSSERDNYDLRFEDTYAAGNTDGGYDLKSTATVMLRAAAVDNKRNFRLWGDISVDSCLGLDPFKRGGSGTQAQIHINPSSHVDIKNCRLIDDSPATIVFDVDDDGIATVTGGCVQANLMATYQTVEAMASLTVTDVVDGCP